MTSRLKKEITEEMYERAMLNRGYLVGSDTSKVFTISELCGYGVYCATVGKEDDKFYVYYSLGSSCD